MELLNKWSENYVEAGCDEAGRGCLCGPVVAAAVVIDQNFTINSVKDSKLLTPKQRFELETMIKEQAVAYAVAEVEVDVIDRHNILNASIHAMHKAIENLGLIPELILVDGNRFHPYNFIPHQCIVKGDGKYLSIAAASILAKNHRDRLMTRLHDQFPEYGWNTNMGYATRDHRAALAKYGPTIHHRKSFRLDYSDGGRDILSEEI